MIRVLGVAAILGWCGLVFGQGSVLNGVGNQTIGRPTSAYTTTNPTLQNTDCGSRVTFSNAGAVAATLPQAGTSSQFLAGCSIDAVNLGAGTVTITPTTSTINGAATLVLTTGQGGVIVSDGTNYSANLGAGSGGSAPTAGVGISVSGSTVSQNFMDGTWFAMEERFCNGATTSGNIGAHGWSLNAVVAGTPTVAGVGTLDNNAPCGIKLVSPAATGDGGALALKSAGASGSFPFPSDMLSSGSFKPFTMKIRMSLSSTSNIRMYLGFSSTPINLLPSLMYGCYFRYDTTVPDSGWTVVCGNSTVTGASMVAGTVDTNPHTFLITCLSSGSWSFSVDGGTATTITQTISTGQRLSPYILVANDGTSTTSFVNVYLIKVQFTGLVSN